MANTPFTIWACPRPEFAPFKPHLLVTPSLGPCAQIWAGLAPPWGFCGPSLTNQHEPAPARPSHHSPPHCSFFVGYLVCALLYWKGSYTGARTLSSLFTRTSLVPGTCQAHGRHSVDLCWWMNKWSTIQKTGFHRNNQKQRPRKEGVFWDCTEE